MHLGTRKRRQHLNELTQPASLILVDLNVFQQQFFVCLAVQPTLPRIDACFTYTPV